MNHNAKLNCPHCGHPQQKQVDIKQACTESYFPVGVRECKTGSGGCRKEFVIYARSTVEVKAKKVVD